MMLEAFERHLAAHDIAKRFEKAQTKDERIEVCKKFLEENGYAIKTKTTEWPVDMKVEPAVNIGAIGSNADPFYIPTGFGSSKINWLTADTSMSKLDAKLMNDDPKQIEFMIKDNLIHKLAKEIVANDFAMIVEAQDFINDVVRYRAKIGVVKP